MRFNFTLLFLVLCLDGWSQPGEASLYAMELFPAGLSGAVCGFSPDGKKIYFVREDSAKRQLHLYEAEGRHNKWENERLLPFSGKYSDLGGRLSADGMRFYFTSDRPGGSQREGDVWNVWMAASNGMGWNDPEPVIDINDKGDECCPLPLVRGTILFSASRTGEDPWQVLEWDGIEERGMDRLNVKEAWQWPSFANDEVLFFNSMKRPDCKGMDDVYVSFFEFGQWQAGINVGGPVNTSVYEDGAILSPDEKLLIFCRHESATTASRVMYVEWKPLLKRLKKLHRANSP